MNLMKKIHLTGKHSLNKFAIVDDEDFERISKRKWWYNKYYGCATKQGKTIYLHRYVINAGPKEVVEHINENPLDCRKDNLIISNQSFNNIRKSKPRKGKKLSPEGRMVPKGVSMVSPRVNKLKPWTSSLQFEGKHYFCGYFKTMEEAEKAYLEKRKMILNELKNEEK